MSLITLILLALSMSVDAFAVTLAKGASCKQPSQSYIIQTALTFGIVEAITPMIGWLIGSATVQYIGAYDHWIAFILLWILGMKMIYEGCQNENHEPKPMNNNIHNINNNIIPIQMLDSKNANLSSQNCDCSDSHQCHKNTRFFNGVMVVTAIVTGIDSMVIGVTLAFMDENIVLISLAIGLATTVMAVIGIKLGHILGTVIGKRAEIFGGLVLMGIGLTILYDHLLN